MLLNKFDTTFGEGAYRAFLMSLGTFLLSFFVFYQANMSMLRGDRIENAAVVGIIAALTPLVGGALIARSDAVRQEKGAVTPADVNAKVDTKKVV